MFLCQECESEDCECTARIASVTCERCNEVGACVDCQCGRRSPTSPEIASRITEMNKTPGHYTGKGGVQPLDLIQAFDLNFCLGNSVKYICRAGRKETETAEADLRKALHYIQLEMKDRGLTP